MSNVNDLLKFSIVYDEWNIVVMDKTDATYRIVYETKSNCGKRPKTMYLWLSDSKNPDKDGHYVLIAKPALWAGKQGDPHPHWCESCYKYMNCENNVFKAHLEDCGTEQLAPQRKCRACYSKMDIDVLTAHTVGERVRCKECRRQLYPGACFNNHECLGWMCPDCGFDAHRSENGDLLPAKETKRLHQHGFSWCHACKAYLQINHHHFMKPLAPPENPRVENVWALDIESAMVDCKKWRDHEPIYINMRQLWTRDVRLQFTSDRVGGLTAIGKLAQWITQLPRDEKHTIVAHNGAKYDNWLIYVHLLMNRSHDI